MMMFLSVVERPPAGTEAPAATAPGVGEGVGRISTGWLMDSESRDNTLAAGTPSAVARACVKPASAAVSGLVALVLFDEKSAARRTSATMRSSAVASWSAGGPPAGPPTAGEDVGDAPVDGEGRGATSSSSSSSTPVGGGP